MQAMNNLSCFFPPPLPPKRLRTTPFEPPNPTSVVGPRNHQYFPNPERRLLPQQSPNPNGCALPQQFPPQSPNPNYLHLPQQQQQWPPQRPSTQNLTPNLEAIIATLESKVLPAQPPNLEAINATLRSAVLPDQSPNLEAIVATLLSTVLLVQPPAPAAAIRQEPKAIGLEFDPALLKDGHEKAVLSLYDDMPRQCASCGCRFKAQEEHRSHMDWHVRKNREAKPKQAHKKKQKNSKRSREWLLSVNLWLTAGEQPSGTTPVYPLLLQAEAKSMGEMKKEEDLVVPADEEQRVCALCRDEFEEFFSHERDEWMYKGAVYLNNGKRMNGGAVKLGPIVHAKCRK